MTSLSQELGFIASLCHGNQSQFSAYFDGSRFHFTWTSVLLLSCFSSDKVGERFGFFAPWFDAPGGEEEERDKEKATVGSLERKEK